MSLSSLASIQINHQYFVDGIDESLYLLPSEKTESLLKRYSLKWIYNQGRFDLRSLKKERMPDEEKILVLYLCSNDGLFTQYSDLPVYDDGLPLIDFSRAEGLNCNFSPSQTLEQADKFPPENCIAELSIPCTTNLLVAPLTEVRPRQLYISTRSFPWKISVVHQRMSQKNDFHIFNENKKLPGFEQLQTEDCISGCPVTEFRSQDSIACSEKSYKKLSLKVADKTVVASIPNPAIHNVAVENGRIYLQSLVYV